jgi:hypothetical protein
MPILRKFMITALASGAVIAAPSAALASATPSTHLAGAAVAKISRVPCRPWTFNVHYGADREICFEGIGRLPFRPPIQNVHEITSGENTGFFFIRVSGREEKVFFFPRQTIPERSAELLALAITRVLAATLSAHGSAAFGVHVLAGFGGDDAGWRLRVRLCGCRGDRGC